MSLQFSLIFSTVFLTNSSVTMFGRPFRSLSWILVQWFLNQIHHWLSDYVVSVYASHSCWKISIGLRFLANRNLFTDLSSQLVGFSVEALFSNYQKRKYNSNLPLTWLDANWTEECSDIKITALLAVAKKTLIYFLYSPHRIDQRFVYVDIISLILLRWPKDISLVFSMFWCYLLYLLI